jgi:3-deoxy-D-manno-octulosonic-acid transferase
LVVASIQEKGKGFLLFLRTMFFFYFAGVFIYSIFLRIVASFNYKAKLWVTGRIDWRNKLKTIPKDKKTIWVHCASLGEFEQGRPIIEKIKSEYPNYFIVLTFFSPSGFEVRKNYEKADLVMYLPIDLPSENLDFIKAINPVLAIFVKYEFWFGYLNKLKQLNIPTLFIAVRFRKNQHFFKWYGGWAQKQLRKISVIHVQDEISKNLLNTIDVNTAIVSGDTRYDRVNENAEKAKKTEAIEKWLRNKKCIIAGSTWAIDDNLMLPWEDSNYMLIIAPHEINTGRIDQIKSKIGKNGILFTEIHKAKDENVLVLNNMGMLLSVYKMGHIAYVGGGFGSGLHNILEPAAFGLPVIFGNKHVKFPEAKALIDAGGAIEISNRKEFNAAIEFLSDKMNYEKASNNCSLFVKSQTGASKLIMNSVNEILN